MLGIARAWFHKGTVSMHTTFTGEVHKGFAVQPTVALHLFTERRGQAEEDGVQIRSVI